MSVDLAILPTVNASLNGVTALLLVTGFLLMRRKRIKAHRAVMLTAFAVSCVFLASYLYYHAHIGSKRFEGEGWIRPVYYTILISHTILAAAVPPLALVTLARGLRRRYDAHRHIARWTLPIWLYVSVTGVIVYLLLYRFSF